MFASKHVLRQLALYVRTRRSGAVEGMYLDVTLFWAIPVMAAIWTLFACFSCAPHTPLLVAGIARSPLTPRIRPISCSVLLSTRNWNSNICLKSFAVNTRAVTAFLGWVLLFFFVFFFIYFVVLLTRMTPHRHCVFFLDLRTPP